MYPLVMRKLLVPARLCREVCESIVMRGHQECLLSGKQAFLEIFILTVFDITDNGSSRPSPVPVPPTQ